MRSLKTNKKIWLGAATGLALMLLTASPETALAQQWTTNGNHISNTNSGNVGIGMTSPGARLQIAADGNGGMRISAASATDIPSVDFISLGTYQGTFGVAAATNQILTGSGAGDFVLRSQNNLLFGAGAAEKMRLTSSGNLGIGTTTPGYKLDVQGGRVNASGGLCIADDCKSAWAQVGGISQWITSGSNVYYSGGNVGIGTTSPGYKLEVAGSINTTGVNINGSPITSSQWTTSGTTINYAGGNVGIGTTAPGYKLDVAGIVNATGVSVNGSPIAGSQWTTSGTNINYASGNVGIGTSTPATKLHVVGDGKVTGNLTVDGTITARYQDIAEWVPASEQVPAGAVVVLDPTKANQVISSTQAYDTRVAGVISERPGITLGERGDHKVLVATTGRVRIMVDATRSPIHIGDLLVTSDKQGVAMKSEPINIGGIQIHRPGTLIGKALESLEKGKGEILALLSLQ